METLSCHEQVMFVESCNHGGEGASSANFCTEVPGIFFTKVTILSSTAILSGCRCTSCGKV